MNIKVNDVIDKCKVFTPEKYANVLLDNIEYTTDLQGKKILENSCGDGEILKIIVKRYIESLLTTESLYNIKKGLESDIYGIELDKKHYDNCIENLNILALKYNLKDIKWNIFNIDTLNKEWDISFDYIVGNPPYISYKDMSINLREILRKKYKSCQKGKYDYYYAFIEESLKLLRKGGKLAYLIPSSFFKNVSGKELRKILLPFLTKIIDYKSQKIFKDALTSSAIILCENIFTPSFLYFDIENNSNRLICKNNLNETWIFKEINNDNKKRFGDYFSASISVATLFNKAFVIKKYEEEEDYIYTKNFKIEKKILKKAASPLGMKKNRKELIIFPYKYEEEEIIRFSTEGFESNFPEANRYLLSFADSLYLRNSDKNAKWFEYGRSQALKKLNRKKILVSSLITNKVEAYMLDENTIPYSGIYIISNSKLSLEEAYKIIMSKEFLEYIKIVGKNANGETIRISPKDINDYYF